MYDTRPTSVSFVNNDEGRREHHLAQPALKSQIPGSSSEGGGGAGGVENEEQASSPYFDLNHSGDVTAVLGKTALLNCRVKNIGNKTVSLFSFSFLKKCENTHKARKSFLLTYLATYKITFSISNMTIAIIGKTESSEPRNLLLWTLQLGSSCIFFILLLLRPFLTQKKVSL